MSADLPSYYQTTQKRNYHDVAVTQIQFSCRLHLYKNIYQPYVRNVFYVYHMLVQITCYQHFMDTITIFVPIYTTLLTNKTIKPGHLVDPNKLVDAIRTYIHTYILVHTYIQT